MSDIYDAHPNEIRPLSLRVRPLLQAAGVDSGQISESLCHISPPWTLPVPEIWLDLTEYKKSETAGPIYEQCLNEIFSHCPGFERIYTDGSKSEDGRVGAAAVFGKNYENSFKHRLLDGSSIYSAELQAILLALKHVYQSKKWNFLILSDSLSALQALQKQTVDHPLLVQILDLHATLIKDGKDIIFVWIPSHLGLVGNSAADRAANEARGGCILDKSVFLVILNLLF